MSRSNSFFVTGFCTLTGQFISARVSNLIVIVNYYFHKPYPKNWFQHHSNILKHHTQQEIFFKFLTRLYNFTVPCDQQYL